MALPRLSDWVLAKLPPPVLRPAYDRGEVRAGIVHLGLGAFHRAHQAVYTDDRLAAGEQDWGIIGLSLRSGDVREALAPQDGLYTVLERSAEGDRARVIGAVLEAVTVPETPERAMAALVDPRTRIISLTVTEKAYCLDAATGSLDETHPGIVADLRRDSFPNTVPGLLVEALRRRHESAAGPCTVLVCDNLPSNGETVARIVARYARLYDPQHGDSIVGDTAFPCTMVDRIVPATTDSDRTAVECFGYRDAWPVVAEPFSQWVIEDRFAAGRPRWEDAGAAMVTDVRPFELMKLRALNGAHSSLAYLGAVAGLETVADAMAEPLLARFLRDLWNEDLLPTIPSVPGMDLSAYTGQLENRFRNPAMRHRLQQIAMDGSQKLPQRLLLPALDRLRQGHKPSRIALTVAAWMRFLLRRDERGNSYEISDPLAAPLTALAAGAGENAEALAAALFGVREIFDPALAGDAGFRGLVVQHLISLLAHDLRRTLAA
nr:mannitol dehydrogenase family protein [uncultured Rhodopila sp.]